MLRPNFWIGIRSTELLKSDEAWFVGHKAAASYLMIGAAWMLIFLSIGGLKSTQTAKNCLTRPTR
ncbi:SdpI family protein [Corynebacterium suranareeae]|uniref:SdpI family protein n=1 Tax=Corynebacterium suranareeae TaxID=2506452 RepID=UPI000BBA5033|nr:SdpI family protein [Corynebacterium suranareeae]